MESLAHDLVANAIVSLSLIEVIFMPQSLSAVYIHLIFSTKERFSFLKDLEVRRATFAYLSGVSKKLDCPTITVGGMPDHVHVLARLGRTISQADWVKEVKRVTNGWLKKQRPQF